MNTTTINSTSMTLKKGDAAVPGAIVYEDLMASFTPTEPMEFSGLYTLNVSTEAASATGKALEKAFKSSFTVSDNLDVTAPTIISTDPTNDAINVVRNKIVSVIFSEEMDPTTINSTTLMVKQAANVVVGTVSYSGTTAKFVTSTILLAQTPYSITITTGAKDLAGNALVTNTVVDFTTTGSISGLAVVDLGSSENYVILAKTAINNNPTSAIKGDLGLSPAATSYITGLSLTDFTGYATSAQVTGKVFAADMASPTSTNLTSAVENMITAYNDAAGRSIPDFLELGTGNIGGKTLVAGLYKWNSTVTIPADITISGSADDVWIFQISGDLSMAASKSVILEGGAKASNIFWQVAGEATFGATSHFEGVILSMTRITFQTGATFNGRALAQTAVILDGNKIDEPK
ncbi:MAG: ice-binding family protein [Salinivirgaceae bacterium]|nr:ice-binding family protein [Salinivirgaceae bacterium]